MANEGSVKLTTPFGDIVAQGFQVIQVLSIAALFWLVYDLNKEREKQLDKLDCRSNLAIWVYSQPRGSVQAALDIPTELWPCIPEFMARLGKR